jgi:RNA-directed DNA polymerase
VRSSLESRRGLSWRIGVPLKTLERLALELDTDDLSHYAPFLKVRPGKKSRLIDNPDDELKSVQRAIRRLLLGEAVIDPSVLACVPGGSGLKNASAHQHRPWLARMDVKKCYPSITDRAVYDLLKRSGYGHEPAALLTRLVTRAGHLPQGAPTSDLLANLYLGAIDKAANVLTRRLGIGYSRGMDDLTFSGGPQVAQAIGPMVKALRGLGLRVSHKKTEVVGPGRERVVFGYGINGKEPKVSTDRVQTIRTAVRDTIRAYEAGAVIDVRLRSIRGYLVYLRQTNHGHVRRLVRQLRAAGLMQHPALNGFGPIR